MTVYLAYSAEGIDPLADGPWEEIVPLDESLAFVASPHQRSAVYHALKDALPSGAALFVAELAEVPKFKGMESGTLAWARHAFGDG